MSTRAARVLMSLSPRLILCMDGLVLREVVLDRERFSIGRKPQNDIQIDDFAISGEHARIITILGDAFLEDLDSTNGTSVNGKPVTRRVLADGDVVELGKYRLKFVSADSSSAQPEVERRRVSEVSTPAAADSAAPASGSGSGLRVPAPTGPGRAVVRVLDGPHAGRQLPIVKARTTLGSPGGEVAVILRRQDGYVLVPLEGACPLVNGAFIEGDSLPLGDRASIELSGVRMEFERDV